MVFLYDMGSYVKPSGRSAMLGLIDATSGQCWDNVSCNLDSMTNTLCLKLPDISELTWSV